MDQTARRAVRSVRRLAGRVVREARRRLEYTSVLVHVSVLLFVPLSVGLLTYLSRRLSFVSFLVLPPLAAGTYALFSDPESESASPVRFVAGLTAGALCSLVAVRLALRVTSPGLPPGGFEVDAPGAAFAVLLTGAVVWALDVEEAAAYAVALLGLLVPPGRQLAFVATVFVTASIVAGVFAAWRELLYERRAEYLYESTQGDDRVLVPMRSGADPSTAALGGRLAAAHDAGKVVLLDIVEGDETAAREQELLEGDAVRADGDAGAGEGPASNPDPDPATATAVSELKSLADRIEAELDVPCEIVAAAGRSSPVETVEGVAARTGCDLIVAPYESEDGELTPYVTRLLRTGGDVVVHRSHDERTRWQRVVVPVRQAGDTAHNMLDFALRLVGGSGRVSVAHCIDSESDRRSADRMLADLVETSDGDIETRVPNADIESFLGRAARTNDLVIIGASQERRLLSRIVSPPTFELVHDVEADVAIVARE